MLRTLVCICDIYKRCVNLWICSLHPQKDLSKSVITPKTNTPSNQTTHTYKKKKTVTSSSKQQKKTFLTWITLHLKTLVKEKLGSQTIYSSSAQNVYICLLNSHTSSHFNSALSLRCLFICWQFGLQRDGS